MGVAKPILMPKLGQTVEESTIVKWQKSEGDQITKGEVIFEIETDKAVLESEAFNEGTLLKILVPAGKSVPVQSVVGFIGEPGDEFPEIKQPEPPKKKPAKEKPRKAPVKSATATPSAAKPSVEEAAPAAPPHKAVSPRARRLCREKLISSDPIDGSGPNGRVVERDVLAYLDQKGYESISITPAARNIAEREELDILEIEGSGDDGKILQSDCERAAKEKPRPMSRMREVIAERLATSFRDTPHFFATVSVDMTDLIEKRKRAKESGEAAYSVTDHIMHAVIRSLKEFDDVNSMTPDGKSVKWNSRVHLGLAVALDHGLVVPVIRDADDLDLAQIHDAAKSLVTKARDGKLTPEEMTGSTFTISNMGMLGIDQFTAIINPGEGAILAVASTVKTPVVKDEEIVVRDIMKMTLSADHRIIDGATAAKFLNSIKSKLEQA